MPANPLPAKPAALARAGADYVRRHYGALKRPHRLILDYDADGEPMGVRLELGPGAAGDLAPGFVPTGFQRGILAALAGVALRTDPLAAAVGDRRRLFRDPGGIAELQEHGLVGHHPRLGYYRPDEPPDEFRADQPVA